MLTRLPEGRTPRACSPGLDPPTGTRLGGDIPDLQASPVDQADLQYPHHGRVVFLHTADRYRGVLDLPALKLAMKYLRSKNISGERLAKRFPPLPGNGDGVAIAS